MKPLDGITVLEIAGMPPTSYAALLMADYGASVIRICRRGDASAEETHGLLRHRATSVRLDLKDPADVKNLLELVERADVLLESFRPGVCERLGIGPEDCRARNPGLVYARLTGWGQTGPYASRPGHDINYIGVAGVLAPLGEPGKPPTIPLNFLGNLAGGGLTIVTGIAAALFQRTRTGAGCVIDGAMMDGAMQLSAALHAARFDGRWRDERRANMTDGGCPFYRCYRTADNRYVAVGAVEPQFYRALLDLLGLPESEAAGQHERALWDERAMTFSAVFAQRTRAEWCGDPRSADACVTPVLEPAELRDDPHVAARHLLVEEAGEVRTVPAPRFMA